MKTYIGDGVYVEHDGDGIWLRTVRADGLHVHEIYLEPNALEALNVFAENASAAAAVAREAPGVARGCGWRFPAEASP